MKYLLSVGILLVVAGCQANRSPDSATMHISETAFVEECLRLRFHEALSRDIPLVIKQELRIFSTVGLIRMAGRVGKKHGEAARDLVRNNTDAPTVEALGELRVNHVVLTTEAEERLFRTEGQDGWEAFYEQYPDSPGIITLSRPGFSRDGTVAMIYIGNQWQWLAGRGNVRIFINRNGTWEDSGAIGQGYVS